MGNWSSLWRLITIRNGINPTYSVNAFQLLRDISITKLLDEVVELGNGLGKLQFGIIAVEVVAHWRHSLG